MPSLRETENLQGFPEGIETIFDTSEHIPVHIVSGSHESLSDFIKRYSYIFSREQGARRYEPYEPSYYRSWETETHDQAMQRFRDEFVKNDLPFGWETDSQHIIELKKLRAKNMTELLFFPSPYEVVASKRAGILKELLKLESFDNLIYLHDQTLLLLDGLNLLYQCDVDFNEDDYDVLEQFFLGRVKRISHEAFSEYSEENTEWFDLNYQNNFPTYPALISGSVDKILEGFSSLEALNNILQTSGSPILPQAFAYLSNNIDEWQARIEHLLPLDKQSSKKNADRYDEDEFNALREEITTYVLRVGVVLKLAQKIRDDGWGEFTMDPSQDDRYEESWNIEKPQEVQIKNYCPPNERLYIVSGPNTAGKSWLMKSDFSTRLPAQSFLFGPAISGGNIHPHDAYCFVERVTSDPDNELSAYTNEVETYARILSTLPDRTRVWLDEAGSTTSPDGQARFVYGIAYDILERGGSVVLGTHNDLLLKYFYSQGHNVYRLATSVNDKNELVTHFRLEEGIGESHTIEVARARAVPKELIQLASNFLNGDFAYKTPVVREYTPIHVFSESQRKKLKEQARGLDHLWRVGKTGARFAKFSIDPDLRPERLFRYREIDPDVVIRGFDEYQLKTWLGKMILEGGAVSTEDLMERQRMFSLLRDKRLYSQILDQVGNGLYFDDAIKTILQYTDVGINNGLNPFMKMKNFEKEEDFNLYIPELLQAASAYLRIQEKVLEREFPAPNMLWQVNVLQELFQMIEFRLGSSYPENHELLSDDEVAIFISLDNSLSNTSSGVNISDALRFAGNIIYQIKYQEYVFPAVPFDVLQQAQIGDELRQLEFFHAKNNNWSIPKSSYTESNSILIGGLFAEGGLPRALLFVSKMSDDIHTLTNILFEQDSVYLHQVAHAIDEEIVISLERVHRENASLFHGQMSHYMAQLATIAYYGAIIDHEGFAPVQFNETGNIVLEHMSPVFVPRDKAVPTSVTFSGNELSRIITGAHGSGKTSFQKEITVNILSALSGGFPFCRGMSSSPIVDTVVYFDRIVHKDDESYSSGAQEMEQWKKLYEIIRSEGRIFVAASVDELGSTMSPRYQAAFSYAMLALCLEEAQNFTLSTHNQAFVDTIINAGLPVWPYHLAFEIRADGVRFDRQIQPGVAGSYPIEIAAMNPNFPRRALVLAQQMEL